MRAVQTVYCTESFFKEIVTKQKQEPTYKVLYRIISNLSNVFIDLPRARLEELAKSDPRIFDLVYKKPHLNFKPKLLWKNEIDFESISDTVFFIDKDYIPDYDIIREHNGCLIIANEDKDLNLMLRMNNRRGYICLAPKMNQDFDFCYQKSWSEALNTCQMQPINSLIINDNYLFKGLIEMDKDESLLPLLKDLIPSKLTIPFHIAIFSNIDNASSFVKEKANKLIEKIRALKPEQNIKVTIVAHTEKSTTHDREILTNYHRLTSTKGYCTIDNKGKIKEIVKGYIEPVFFCVAETPDSQMIVKHFHSQMIKWLKKIYHRELGVNGHAYIVGDRVHRMLD